MIGIDGVQPSFVLPVGSRAVSTIADHCDEVRFATSDIIRDMDHGIRYNLALPSAYALAVYAIGKRKIGMIPE